ncbi:hypothetical protein RDWZM_007203 [Blomia tropicalis]|uniref:Uncharacterized protein n=1 Tax=Blomia tropicalis TaxID=40697 RepID=A0A9Q0RP52_BLOTA|nr:hypothetical protein RDWZM_007203 [Blomia tropicalis]
MADNFVSIDETFSMKSKRENNGSNGKNGKKSSNLFRKTTIVDTTTRDSIFAIRIAQTKTMASLKRAKLLSILFESVWVSINQLVESKAICN